MSFSERAFRDCMGRFATGVCVMGCPETAAIPEPIGLTVNSFSSVSLKPALVLWCIDKDSDRFAAFAEAPTYSVNVLKADQRALSDHFAAPGGSLGGIAHRFGATGAPLLEGALCALECKVEHRYDGGDHEILVGRVLDLTPAAGGEPLLYFGGGYAGLSR